MVNPSKNKGTKAESDLVKWARANGFPHAERLALKGAHDGGDVRLTPLGWTAGLVVIEVKAQVVAGRGVPADAQLAAWLKEAEAERVTSGADHCPLVLRRSGPGAGDPGRWWAWLPTWSFAGLIEDEPLLTSGVVGGDLPVLIRLDSLAVLLRLAGYGADITGQPFADPVAALAGTVDPRWPTGADPWLPGPEIGLQA